MKALELMNLPPIFIELAQSSLTIFNGVATSEMLLERQADGKLTESCQTSVTLQLQKLINRKSWQPRVRVYCAVAARGVSLRRLALPTSNKDDLQRLLPLQIEREFPLPPDQLAWGSLPVASSAGTVDHSNGKQELLIAAVKRDTLEQYASIILASGATPIFTLAALARTYICPQPPGPYAVLGVASNYSELVTLESGVPTSLRVLPWGREQLSSSSQVTHQLHADPLSLVPSAPNASFGGTITAVPAPIQSGALDPLVRLLTGQSLGRTLYVTGVPQQSPGFDLLAELGLRLGTECRAVELPASDTASAAVLGLQRAVERHAGWPPLVLQLKQINGKSQFVQKAPLKWAGIAAGLLGLALLLPYAEALVLKSHVAKTLAATKADQNRLAVIDRELDFLQYLKDNEAPYLDALLVLAKAAPPGTRFDSVGMNRRGDITLRGSLRNGQEVADLRSKLIASGFLANVGVEEQAPTPDHQKVNVRITAQWKPSSARISPAVEPARPGSELKGSPAVSGPSAPSGPEPPPPVLKTPPTKPVRQ